MSNTTKKIVLVTGGNAGIGFHACLHIAKQDNYHVILTGRNTERVHAAAEKVRAVAATTTTVEEGILDLNSLAAVKKYAEELKKRADVPELVVILLNAGILSAQKQTTVDGYEASFAVNHLGHFLLATLLRENTKRFVIVSSEAHDPVENSGFPAPDVSDLDQLPIGLADPRAAYSTSKLCNMLFMYEWLRRFPNEVEFAAYTPGFTPDTASVGQLDPHVVAGIIAHCKSQGLVVNTSDAAGAFMSRLVVEDWQANGWKNGDYFSNEVAYHASEQATDAVLGETLWNKSEELVKRALTQE